MHCQPLRDFLVNICSKFNQRCYLCQGIGDNPYPLCSGCEGDLPWLSMPCQRCALPLAFDGPLCHQCQHTPPPFEQVAAPWAYDFPLDAAIKCFKHRQDWPMGQVLAERLATWLAYRFEEGLAPAQQLLPVPLAAARQRKRGFNQAQMLGQWLSKRLAIPLCPRALVRTKHTPSQQGLGLAARQQNLQAAFELGPGAQVAGQHVALVDDVLTTGATARALAALLLKAGARRVDVYCLARTPGVGPVI